MSDANENRPEVLRFMADMIDSGKFIPQKDGTFKLSDEMRELLQSHIDKKPELYAQLFPERLQ